MSDTFTIGGIHGGGAGPQLHCDIEKLVDSRLLVQANSGGGKSWLVRRILEQTHGRVQQLVIDPEGEFASLREKFDYVHAAPRGGDTVAQPRSAALLAERLLELGVSAVLDIYELKAHERVLFVRRFLEALVDAPKKLWHPALVVIDEAHVFAPQKGDAESASAVIDLATRGRKRGFCAVLATQRLSKLHKDAAAELNNKLVGRTGLDVDVKRAADELGFAKERWRELRELSPGTFFAFGPAMSVAGVVKVSSGPVLTTHPKAGSRVAFVAPPPTAKVRALLPQLADLPAEAEQRQRSAEELQKRMRELERELATAQKAQPAPAPPECVEVLAVTPGQLEQLDRTAREIAGLADRLEAAANDVGAALARVKAAADRPPALVSKPDGLHRDGKREAVLERTLPKPAAVRSRPPSSDAPRLNRGEHAILTAIAQHDRGVSREQLSVLTGYKRSSRDTYLQRVHAAGLVEYAGDVITATAAGVEALGDDFEPLPTGRALRDHWLGRLPEGERRVLEAVLAVYPEVMPRERIDGLTDYKRSSRDTYLQRLAARKLVVVYREGVRASELLFDGGRR